MAARHFDVLVLIARPAAGKSEIIDYLAQTPPEERWRRFHVGRSTCSTTSRCYGPGSRKTAFWSGWASYGRCTAVNKSAPTRARQPAQREWIRRPTRSPLPGRSGWVRPSQAAAGGGSHR